MANASCVFVVEIEVHVASPSVPKPQIALDANVDHTSRFVLSNASHTLSLSVQYDERKTSNNLFIAPTACSKRDESMARSRTTDVSS